MSNSASGGGQAANLRDRFAAALARMRDWRVISGLALLSGIILGATAVYLALAVDWEGRTPEEQRCAALVQGRIAWNDDGSTNWDEPSLDRLCRGTTRPVQPGLCFSLIRNVPLQRGAAIQADWKDAVALCAGTDGGQERVSCYRRAVDNGLFFRDAIAECTNPPIIAGRTACERLVQNNIAWNKQGDTRWTAERLDALCAETNNPTQPLLCFDRLFHGSGPWDSIIGGTSRRAIQLCAGTNSAAQISSCVTETLAKLEGANLEADPQIVDAGEQAPPPQSRSDRLFAAVRNACNPRRSTDFGDRCKQLVQGSIAWSTRGFKTWQPAVLDELCGDTRAPEQPGLCFARALSGEIAEDAKGASKWAYAVQLCAGTSNADLRLDCYEREQAAGKGSRAAIRACKEAEED